MTAKFIIGIDLGTTNSVVAYAPYLGEAPQIQLLPIPQLVAPGTIEARTQLPSFLYLAPPQETAAAQWDLPWQSGREFAVGEVARLRSAEAPDRTVVAAKSWLCQSRADRRAAILPWNAPPEVAKVSPVTAAGRYLEHLAVAWAAAWPDAPLAEQHVVLTVPASFDAGARELTREAALAAGLPPQLVLLEEPQAAVYAWLDQVGDHWRKLLKLGDTLLVCDVGGGTTDLTLVGAAEEQGELVLRRVAVGPHLLVGGDNMDLALAVHVAARFQEQGVTLDPWQSISLWHSCRAAKEQLLAEHGPAVHPITVLSRGSRLIGGAKTLELTRDEVTALLVEGFFPQTSLTAKPVKRRGSGFQEIGLPFEQDTAVTRHLAAFLLSQAGSASLSGAVEKEATTAARPTRVLFNGGVFKANALQQRLLAVLGEWFAAADSPGPRMLDGAHDLDHAVARGAVLYGWSKQRGGVRIRGGAARSYYVGIESAGLAIPGAPRPLRALCVVPFGMEEGTELAIPSAEIGLVVGEPAHFRFFSSLTRKTDQPGTALLRWTDEELSETDSLEMTLPAAEEGTDDYVPIRFHAKLTELGMFELWCVSATDARRWKLEFSVREE